MFSNPGFAAKKHACEVENLSGIVYEKPPLFSLDKQSNIDISADKTLSDKNGSSAFEGDVVIEKHELRVKADRADYDNINKQITVTGNVHVDTPAMSVDADSGKFLIDSEYSELLNIRFYVPETSLRGSAVAITSSGKKLTRLDKSSITSCPPDDIDWLLDANSIELDLEEEYGKARGVVLEFKNIPFLYTPYIAFPVGDKRRSGLLAPTIGTSSSRGFELAVPWYWNIAPNQDAIIAPHYMNRRGTQLDTQYRYLTRTTRGQLDLNYLYEDKITNEQRYSVIYNQQTNFNNNIQLAIDYKDVSDSDYLSDFSNSLLGASLTHLPRSARIDANYTNWYMLARVQTYETLDLSIAKSNRPYRILPQIKVNGDEKISDNLNFTLGSEWVNFVHEDNTKIEGPRFNIQPGVELDLKGSAWYFKPAIEYYYTTYNAKDGSGASVSTDDINVPITSIDSGLIFERTLGNNFIQTLEPRLFYLNIPFQDQSALPLFDTSVPDLIYEQMFRKNRFNGSDRIGDANQVTLALSSRIIDPASGNEFMSASIGQIYYFNDRRVTLSGTPETLSSSDVIGDINGHFGQWNASARIQWDTAENNAAKGDASVHYESENNSIFNFRYSMRRQAISSPEALEQTDLSFVAPVSNNITFLGRWNYSLEQQRDLEVIAGISYDSCCWSMIIALQRNLVNSSSIVDAYDNTILFQLVLKGLGSVSGDSAANILKQSILGFKQDY